MKRAAAAILLCAAGGAHAGEPFSTRDWQLQLAYTAVHLADYAQTRDIKNRPGMRELNPLLGDHPGDARVRNYFAATLAAHWAITYALSPKYRPYWQGVTIAIEVGVVARNYNIGLRVAF